MHTVIKRYLGCALVGVFVLCLAACGNRSLNSKIDDQFIASEVVAAVERAHPDLDSPTSHIVVSSYNAVVLLGGQTPREELKLLAERAARKVAGVHKLYNELQVLPPTSSLVRGNDALLTSSIKAQMLADTRVASTRVKVVTENGVVFLLGIVTRQQASDATAVVQTVNGVQKVVQLFQYLD